MLKEREPYAPPSTSMERHIRDLVDHLREGHDTQAGFNSKVESAMAHAHALEEAAVKASLAVRDMERRIAIAAPPISFSSGMIDTAAGAGRYADTSQCLLTFDWGMEPIRYRVMLREWQAKGDETLKARIKRSTYRSMLRLFRKQFEECFNLNPSFYRARARQEKIMAAVKAAAQ